MRIRFLRPRGLYAKGDVIDVAVGPGLAYVEYGWAEAVGEDVPLREWDCYKAIERPRADKSRKPWQVRRKRVG